MLAWLYRPIDFMDACRRRYGDAFSVTFPGFETPMVLVSHPEMVRAIFANRENGLPPGRALALEPVLGPRSVLLQSGEEHLTRRKLMLPPFHGERMRAYEGVVEEVIEREIDSWPLGTKFAIHPRMQSVTLEVILRAVFGVSDQRRLAALRPLLAGILSESASPVLQLRVLAYRRFGRGRDPLAALNARMAKVHALLDEEIAERRADGALEDREDILSLLVAARFEDGDSMSDEELRSQLMTLLLAGHETTATALAWAFDLLLRNRPVLDRLREELATGDQEYLKATINEALRLRPVVPLAGRRLAADLDVAGLHLPAGTDVTPAIWLVHTREDLYPDPRAFRPERFLEKAPETYGWVPFGGGVRRCLGAAFAEFEMRIVLRAILERIDLTGARKAPERIARRNITFSPKEGTPVIATARRESRTPVAA
jgi:cytochrome P450 family 135